MEEQLTQQQLVQAQGRVAQALSTSGTAVATPVALAAQPMPSAPLPTARATRVKATRARRTGTPNQAASADGQPTVNISLPKDIHDYFQQQADADERTLAKYLQRLLKQVYQQQVSEGQGTGDGEQ